MQWFADRRTATKLVVGFGITLALLGALGVFSIHEMGVVNGHSSIIADDWLPSTRTALEIKSAENDFRLKEYGHVLSTEVSMMDQREKEMASVEESISRYLDDYEKTVLSDEDRALADAVRTSWSDYVAQHDRNIDLSRKRSPQAEALLGDRRAAFETALAAADELVQYNVDAGKEASASAQATYTRAKGLIVGLLLAALLIGLGLAGMISRMLSRPLRRAVEILGRVADGDFTARLDIDTKDEVGDLATALNSAVHNVRIALQEVRASADVTSQSARELQSASEEISGGAQEQASNLEETAASLEQMTASVKQNADSAQQASQLAEGARDVAEKGGHVVRDAVNAMGEITESSRRIADIITTIDEIAFQTNILALNAAVEAARAGQQGRGFAVVAGEVRKLAQRSATAAREIKGLIQDSTHKVEGGTELVRRSGTSLEEIVVSVKRVTDIVSEMAAASREQASGIDQVNQAVVQMDSVTQANAGQTEELASTAEGLAAQAEQLQRLVGRFKVDEAARHAAKPPRDEHVQAAPKPSSAPSQNGKSIVRVTPARGYSSGNGKGRKMAAVSEGRSLPDLDDFEEY